MKHASLTRDILILLSGTGIIALLIFCAPLAVPLVRVHAALAGPSQGTPTATPGCGGPSPWGLRAALPYAAEAVSVASDGNYVYTNGGSTNGAPQAHNETYRYDPVFNTWTPLAPSPDGHYLAPAAYGGNGKIYVFGGISNGVTTDTVRIYDIASNSWSTGTPMSQPLSDMGIGYYNGKIYIAGGSNGNATQETWAYNIGTDSWTTLADMPQALFLPGFGIINGQLYLAGGSSAAVTNLDTLYIYNIATDSWTAGPNLLLGVDSPGSAVMNGKLWVFGGGYPAMRTTGPSGSGSRQPANNLHPAVPESTNSTQIYDPLSNTWSSGPPMNVARLFFYGAAVGYQVFAIGGTSASGDVNTNEAASDAPCPTSTATPTPVPTNTNPPSRTPIPPSRTPIPPSTSTPTPSAPPPPPPAAGPLVSAPAIQDSPDVDGNYLVWEDDGAGTWDVKAKDLGTNVTFPVVQAAGDQRLPRISGNLVVWQDNRNGTWDIYGARLNGDTAGPAFPIATGAGDQTHPAVSGNLVTWESTTGTRSDVRVVDVSGGQPRTLSDATTTNSNPAIDGTLVVWQSAIPTTTLELPQAVGDWDIRGIDLNSGGSFAITNGGGQHTNPAISRNLVVWQEFGAAGHWTIAGMDLNTGSRFAVTNAPGDQTDPAISDGEVVYLGTGPAGLAATPLDCGGGTGSRAVRRTGARSGGTDDTPISAYGCSAGRPRTRHGRDVWDQDPPGVSAQADIYGNACTISFGDVHTTDYFYAPVQALTCAGAISGYADNTFRPYNDTTRGQLTKIIVLGEGWTLNTSGGPHFSDVPSSNPFYPFVETAYNRGIISGYADGTFRWGANVTRGQLAKIIVTAQGWAIDTAGGPHFSDVPPSNPFYAFIETARNRNVISGYADGTFRWGANATRGQIAKIVWGALTQP